MSRLSDDSLTILVRPQTLNPVVSSGNSRTTCVELYSAVRHEAPVAVGPLPM